MQLHGHQPPPATAAELSAPAGQVSSGDPRQAPCQVAAQIPVAVDQQHQLPAVSSERCNRLSEGVEQGGGCHQPPPATAAELSAPAGQVSSGDPRQTPCQVAARFDVAVDQGLRPPASHSWSPQRLSERVEQGGGCNQPPSASAEELSTPAAQVPSVVPRQAPCQVAAHFDVAVDQGLRPPASHSWPPRRLSESVEQGGGCQQPPSASAEELSTPAGQVHSVVPRQAPCQVAAHFDVAVDQELHPPASRSRHDVRLSEGVEQGGGCQQPPSAAAEELSTPAGQVSSGNPRHAPCQLAARSDVAVEQGLHPPASRSWHIVRLSEGVEQGGGCHQPPSAEAEELSTPAGQVSSGDPQQGPRQVAAQFEVEVDQELHLPAAYPQPIISLPSDSQPVAAHKPVTGDQEIYATACQISAGTWPTPLAAPTAPPPAVTADSKAVTAASPPAAAAASQAAPAAPPSAEAAAPLAAQAAPPSAQAAAPLAAQAAPPSA